MGGPLSTPTLTLPHRGGGHEFMLIDFFLHLKAAKLPVSTRVVKRGATL